MRATPLLSNRLLVYYLTHLKFIRIKYIIDNTLSMNLSLEHQQALPINSSQLAA